MKAAGDHITIVSELAADLPMILADPTNVDQVVMNIVINARDAMPEGGRLTIAIAEHTLNLDIFLVSGSEFTVSS